MGNLDDTVAAAAKMVGLPADRATYFQDTDSPAERLLRRLHSTQAALSGNGMSFLPVADKMLRDILPFSQYNFLVQGDPQHMYSHCLLPLSALTF